jgi:hypothetical protein
MGLQRALLRSTPKNRSQYCDRQINQFSQWLTLHWRVEGKMIVEESIFLVRRLWRQRSMQVSPRIRVSTNISISVDAYEGG